MAAIQLTNSPIPLQDPITRVKRAQYKEKPDPQEGLITDTWAYYLTTLAQVVTQSPNRISSATVTAQTGSINTTDFSGGAINSGLYRVSYYARITTAASGTSSLQVTIQWTDHGVLQAFNGDPMTGNTIGTFQQGGGLLFSDAASPISYSTVYASTGAGAMQYALYIILETINA
jgi:hypothetical protein